MDTVTIQPTLLSYYNHSFIDYKYDYHYHITNTIIAHLQTCNQ
jgi:hypothetical protein